MEQFGIIKMKNLNKSLVVEFDDLCDNTMDKLKYVEKLKSLMPGFKCTLFAIPKRISDDNIKAVKAFDYISLGMHGWIHTTGEMISDTSERIVEKMTLAFNRGIDGKIFRAPKWIIDEEVYYAAKSLDWVVADHKDFRILGSGARTYTYNQPLRNPKWTRVHGHLPNVSQNGIEEYFDNYVFEPDREFKFITEVV